MSRRNSGGGGVFHPPEELLSEILIRLPVKSIGRSRCVSKHWNSLLTTPRFIKSHIARSQSQQKHLLVLRNNNSLSSFTLCPDGVAKGTFENRQSIPILDQDFILVGHCNGLVLIGTTGRTRSLSIDAHYLLMNPTTLEHSRLPQRPSFSSATLQQRNSLHVHEYGLGYDRSSEDYKVVQLFAFCKTPVRIYEAEFCDMFADIYSVKDKCWRRVNLDYRRSDSLSGKPGLCFNGALHWLCNRSMDTIFAFGLATEKWYEIPSIGRHPEHTSHVPSKKHRLTTLNKGSCLGIVCWDRDIINIWTMKEYGISESWTKSVYVDEGANMIGENPWLWRDTVVFHYPYKLTFYSLNDDKSFSTTLETRTIHGDEAGHTDDDDDDETLLSLTLATRTYPTPVYKRPRKAEFLHDGLIFTESLLSPLSL